MVLTSLTDRTKIQRINALVDTGFSGTLCISETLKKKLGLKIIQKVKTENADENVKADDVAGIAAVFMSLEAEKTEYKIPTLVKPIKTDCVIGMQLLQLFAKDNQAHLVFNYLQDKIQFLSA